ncbi:MAG TPA: pirin family protein [Acidiferrobacter sp.]|nr:pirin family protein [Acidiferrobacter sp.]
MITIRPSQARGYAEHGWLTSHHTFSFADYYDPQEMGFSDLRVINEDVISGGGGFAPHPHRDMEILTYVLAGALRHEDSMGNGSIIHAGDAQRMSAGSGVIHSEANASTDTPVHLFQIWLRPDRAGYTPEYEQQTLAKDLRRDRFQLIASGDHREPGLHWHQDARLLTADLAHGTQLAHALAPGRCAYLQVISGAVTIGALALVTGDGCRIEQESGIVLAAQDESAVLIFDLRVA